MPTPIATFKINNGTWRKYANLVKHFAIDYRFLKSKLRKLTAIKISNILGLDQLNELDFASAY